MSAIASQTAGQNPTSNTGHLQFVCVKDLMQGKLFQKCMHVLYCSVLSLGGNVNTRRISNLSHK